MQKTRLLVLCGGPSAEHQISLISAYNIISALNRQYYEIIVVGISKNNEWLLYPSDHFIDNADNTKQVSLAASGIPVRLVPGKALLEAGNNNSESIATLVFDVVFPVLHGTWGEDGGVQGLLHTLNVPYVGAGILSSAMCMHKVVTKQLLQTAGLPVVPYRYARLEQINDVFLQNIVTELGLPCFVKAVNQGSSIGISKVKQFSEFTQAIEEAVIDNDTILFEKYIPGREIECAVLGNQQPQASVLGEIIPTHEFYSYDAKYIDEQGAELIAPVILAENVTEQIQAMAISAFQTLSCQGMARVDFFLTDDNQIYINELNTIPGFTTISMYPRLWQLSGITYTELLDKLINFALEAYVLQVESQVKV